MKFYKQRDGYSCGPVAILNALVWGGALVTYSSHFKKISKKCKTTTEGTDSLDFERALRFYGKNLFTVRRRVNIEVDELIDHILSGGAFILASVESPGMVSKWIWDRGSGATDWHLSLWHNYSKGRFRCAQGKRRLTPDQMEGILEESSVDRKTEWYEVFLLKKK